jgi:hypothetical protein
MIIFVFRFLRKTTIRKEKMKKLAKGKGGNKATAIANSERTYLEREDG